MSQQTVEVLTTLIDNSGKAYDFRPCAYYDEKFQFPVILKIKMYLVC